MTLNNPLLFVWESAFCIRNLSGRVYNNITPVWTMMWIKNGDCSPGVVARTHLFLMSKPNFGGCEESYSCIVWEKTDEMGGGLSFIFTHPPEDKKRKEKRKTKLGAPLDQTPRHYSKYILCIYIIYKGPLRGVWRDIPGVAQVEKGHAGNAAAAAAYLCWVKHGHRSSRTGVPADYYYYICFEPLLYLFVAFVWGVFFRVEGSVELNSQSYQKRLPWM